VTSHELVRMADRVGADIMRVTYDSANTVLRGEDPHAVARRLAPLVAKTHLRDIRLSRDDDQIYRRLVPCGDGVLDWHAILTALLTANPELNLTIENATDYSRAPLYTRDPLWQIAHPDLDETELATIEGWGEDIADDSQSDSLAQMSELEQKLFVARSAHGLQAAWASNAPQR
jgi:sugar phosphate isomerase/epimerase